MIASRDSFPVISDKVRLLLNFLFMLPSAEFKREKAEVFDAALTQIIGIFLALCLGNVFQSILGLQ